MRCSETRPMKVEGEVAIDDEGSTDFFAGERLNLRLHPPWVAFAIVVMWSVIELCGIRHYGVLPSNSATDRETILAVLYGGPCAGILFAATWWIIGASPRLANNMSNPAENQQVGGSLWREDCFFRIAVLLLALTNLSVCALAIEEGILVLGCTVVAIPIAMLFPIAYRQLTGRCIAKHFSKEKAAFDIRGLMLMTLLMAIAGAVTISDRCVSFECISCCDSIRVQLRARLVRANRNPDAAPYLWTVASLLLVVVHGVVIVGIGIFGPYGLDDTLSVLAPITGALYLHGLMYWSLMRAADYRLEVADAA